MFSSHLFISLHSYPALAKLPESSRPEEAFALTRVVAEQNEQNHVFVAMDGKKLVSGCSLLPV